MSSKECLMPSLYLGVRRIKGLEDCTTSIWQMPHPCFVTKTTRLFSSDSTVLLKRFMSHPFIGCAPIRTIRTQRWCIEGGLRRSSPENDWNSCSGEKMFI